MTTAAIMQPTYLAWAGYYALIDQADIFILDDLAQYVAKSWHSRNRIRSRDGATIWLTVPVHGHRAPLNQIEIDNTKAWKTKHWRNLKAAYSHTPGWPLINEMYQPYWAEREDPWDWNHLSILTSALIRGIAATIGITTPIVKASDLGNLRPGMAERIIDLCRAVDATTLLDTTGAQPFLNQTMLEDITLQWHHYQPTPYPQGSQEWQPKLSIIDTIAWTTPNTLTTIRGNPTAKLHSNRETGAHKARATPTPGG